MSRSSQIKAHLGALIMEISLHTPIRLRFHICGIWRAIIGV